MKMRFSQLPIWYRLSWVFGASLFIILAYFFMVFFSLEFVSDPPTIGCVERETLETLLSFNSLEEGKSYAIKNLDITESLTTETSRRPLEFYLYTSDEQEVAQYGRFGRFIENCEGLKTVIGELHSSPFSYSDSLTRSFSKYVVGEDKKIFELVILEGK